jgi:hypothetical protein
MIQSKQTTINRADLIRFLQTSSLKKIYLYEPYFTGDEKAILELLKRHKSDEVSIIVGIAS